MKKVYKNVLPLFMLLLVSYANGQNNLAPEREWSRMDWTRNDPETGLSVSQEESGEDWWFDHANTYDENGNHNGYVAVGFNYGINRIIDYDLSDLDNDGHFDGMDYCNANFADPKTELFESAGNTRRCGRAMLMKFDLNGKSLIGCKNYNQGELISVIQTDDGGFLALGYTGTTINMPNDVLNSYADASIRPAHIGPDQYLFYNPRQSNPLNNFNASGVYSSNQQSIVSLNYFRMGRRPFLVKTDSDGNVIWNYQYGGFDFDTEEELAFTQIMQYGKVIAKDDGYIIVYSTSIFADDMEQSTFHTSYKSFMISIDGEGYVEWIEQLFSDGFIIEAIAKHPFLQNQYAISGVKNYPSLDPFNFRAINNTAVVASITIDNNGVSYNWNIGGNAFYEAGVALQNPTLPWQRVGCNDIDFKNDGSIIFPFLDKCNSCFGSGHNLGEVVFTILNHNNGTVVTSNVVGWANAYDFKLSTTPTLDGGFALLTSKGNFDTQGNLIPLDWQDPSLMALYPNFWFKPFPPGQLLQNVQDNLPTWIKYWNTIAYLIKVAANNAVEWEKKYNVDETPRQPFPGDLKKQECVYAVTEAADGSFVISGNSSHNFDDCLLIKTFSNCQKLIVDEMSIPPPEELIISSNTTWSTNQKIASKVIVESGNTLTIDGATIEFADSRQLGYRVRLEVMSGAKLVLTNGAVLTSIGDCPGSVWDGLVVMGNSNLPQNQFNQGSIEILGSAQNYVTIANAVDAISTLGYTNQTPQEIDWQSFGGIIQASFCRFENNLRDVQFMKYEHFENGTLMPNVSYFNHSIFVKDREFLAPNFSRGAFVSLWDVHGVTFTACKFEYDGVPLKQQAVKHGIFSIDANYTVTWDCQTPDPLLGCVGADSTYFKNMEFGIRAEYSKGFMSSNLKVHGAAFKSVNGFYMGGSYNNIATRNSFYVDKKTISSYPNIPYGLYLDYATGFVVQENEFHSNDDTGINSAGLVINNSGGLYNLVYNNKFSNFQMGLSAQSENRSIDGETGLECRCNDFEDGEYDISVYGNPNTAWDGIQRNQGAFNTDVSSDLASNLFSLTGTAYSDYFNGANYINYHHHDPNFGSNPANVEPVDVFSVFKFPYFEDYEPCPQRIPSGKTKNALFAEIQVAQQSVSADEGLLAQLLNEDDVALLEAQILFASYIDDWFDVYLDLMEQSPFLDFGIIEGLIQNTDFPDLMLRNIMIANPDAAKESHLMDLIDQRNMPSWMVTDIIEGQSSYGAKEVLIGRIGYNKGKQQTAISDLLRQFNDSTSNGLDSSIVLLQSRSEAQYHYMLADIYLSQGQYVQALQVINNLPSTTVFTEKDSLDYAAYEDWYTLQANLVESNLTWFDADSTQKATLMNLADTSHHHPTMLWANYALRLLGEEIAYQEPVYLPNGASQKRHNPATAPRSTPQELVKVYPNPAKDVVHVMANGVVKGRVDLYTLNGQHILQQEINHGLATINVSALAQGMYVARIYAENDEELQTVKIVVGQ